MVHQPQSEQVPGQHCQEKSTNRRLVKKATASAGVGRQKEMKLPMPISAITNINEGLIQDPTHSQYFFSSPNAMKKSFFQKCNATEISTGKMNRT